MIYLALKDYTYIYIYIYIYIPLLNVCGLEDQPNYILQSNLIFENTSTGFIIEEYGSINNEMYYFIS